MRINVICVLLLILVSCKKEEKKYFEDGKIKYVSVLDGDVLNFKRFDEQGNLMFVGKFKNNQLIDTLLFMVKRMILLLKLIVRIVTTFMVNMYLNTQRERMLKFLF